MMAKMTITKRTISPSLPFFFLSKHQGNLLKSFWMTLVVVIILSISSTTVNSLPLTTVGGLVSSQAGQMEATTVQAVEEIKSRQSESPPAQLLLFKDGDDGDFLYLTDNDADNSIDGGDDIEVIPFTLSGWGQGKTSQEVRPGEQVSEGVPPPPSFDETGKVIINKPSSLMTQRLISNRRIQ